MQYNKIIGLLLLSLTLGGCSKYASPKPDPMEPLNRGIYKFNKVVDALYIKPVSKTYDMIVPPPVKYSVTNFFNNVDEVPTVINDLLQAKYRMAVRNTARFVINSTMGILGLFDVATYMGLERKHEDFGQTMAEWGYKESSYFVIPILGPSTIRDTIGTVANTFMSPNYYLEPKWRNRYYVGQGISKRAELFDTEKVITAAGVDEYAMVRNAYLQRRNHSIKNGKSSSKEILEEPPK